MAIDHDTLIAYALGTLSPQETQAIERELPANPDAEAELRALQDSLADLVMELPPEPVSPDAERALLARLNTQRPAPAPRRNIWLWPLVAAACVALAIVGVGNTSWYQGLQVQQQLQAYSGQAGAVRTPLLASGGRSIGTTVRLPDGRVFVALDQPPPGSDRVYQAWSIAGGVIRSLGVFNGRTFLTQQATVQSGQFGITVEPLGGSTQPTSAPIGLAAL